MTPETVTLYYELIDPAQPDQYQYLSAVIVDDREKGGFTFPSLVNGQAIQSAYIAQRIWMEHSEGVHFIKNREHGLPVDVDIKEFMWVKLRSHLIT